MRSNPFFATALAGLVASSCLTTLSSSPALAGAAATCTGSWSTRGSSATATLTWDGNKVKSYDFNGSVPVHNSQMTPGGVSFDTPTGTVTLYGVPAPGQKFAAGYGGGGSRARGSFTC